MQEWYKNNERLWELKINKWMDLKFLNSIIKWEYRKCYSYRVGTEIGKYLKTSRNITRDIKYSKYQRWTGIASTYQFINYGVSYKLFDYN